ncbi:MAG TPA: uracil phosphoribosyltransferase [Chthoniobacterales bacterium]|nr:uracil phosphoribosyltransferase [Chthoniobacterales bacterium]
MAGRDSVEPKRSAKNRRGSTESRPTRDDTSSAQLLVVDHPIVAAGLSILRDKTSTPDLFRRHLQEIAIVLLTEASRGWGTAPIEVQTPLASCAGAVLAKPVVLVPILRAGLGLLDGIMRILPDASIGHIGLYRDAETLRPVSYFDRLPVNIAAAQVLLLDPMLATGHTACEAASILKTHGALNIQLLCVLACPPGVQQFQSEHPDVPIITAAVDPELNEFGYIVPGLGDAGDRYFGTG